MRALFSECEEESGELLDGILTTLVESLDFEFSEQEVDGIVVSDADTVGKEAKTVDKECGMWIGRRRLQE